MFNAYICFSSKPKQNLCKVLLLIEKVVGVYRECDVLSSYPVLKIIDPALDTAWDVKEFIELLKTLAKVIDVKLCIWMAKIK